MSIPHGDNDDYEWGFLVEYGPKGYVWHPMWLVSKQTHVMRHYEPEDPHLGVLYEESMVYGEPDLSAENGYDFPSSLIVPGYFPRNRAEHHQLYRLKELHA